MSVDKLFKKLRPLVQYKKLSDEDLMKLVRTKVEEKEQLDEYDVDSFFSDKNEKKKANELLKKYITEFAIENISDKNSLKQLVYLEMMNVRFQDYLNKLHEDSKAVPLKALEAVHRNLDKIGSLKVMLGLVQDKKEKKSAYDVIALLKKKAKLWRSENQGTRTAVCGYCGQMLWFKIRTDKYECDKHPFFKDKVLTNDHLVKMYMEKKIEKEDVSKILGTSPDYVDWLVEKWYTAKKIELADMEVKSSLVPDDEVIVGEKLTTEGTNEEKQQKAT